MRIGRCIAVELSLAGSLIFGAGFVAERAVSAAAAQLRGGVRSPPDRRVATLLPRADISRAPAFDIAEEPAGTFLGMADDLLLERVRTQPITSFKVKTGGTSLSFRVDFADGSRAAWKPAQTNLQTIPRKEVAAYRLNRLLGLNAVPPAAPRAVSREELFAHLDPESAAFMPRIQAETVFDPKGRTLGAASYWIPVIKDSGFDTPEGMARAQAWLSLGQPIPPESRALAMQLSDLAVFDFLTSNPDRYSGGNMKMSPDGSRLYYMDNTMSFFLQPEGNDVTRQALVKTQRFSRRLHQALDRLDFDAVRRALADEPDPPYEILTPAEIKAVIARRDAVRRHIDMLAMQFGERNVLAFP